LLSATDYTVNTANGGVMGSGNSGSLAYVVNKANADTNPAGELISFDSTAFPAGQVTTIDVLNTLDVTAKNLNIIAGNDNVAISGNDRVEVMSVSENANVSLVGLTIIRGSAVNGGAINNLGTMNIISCEITNNVASQYGGDIFNSGSMRINMSVVSGGSAGSGGGGIVNTGTLNLPDVTITGNTAAGWGGGLENSGTTDIFYATFNGNTAAAGGGLANASGTLMISDATVTGNSATVEGGGIVDAATLIAVNDTIASNSVGASGSGGGLSATSTAAATLSNTIVALNLAGTGSSAVASDIGGSISSSSAYNLIGTGGSGGLASGTEGNLVGVAPNAVGLSSAGLANNGGSLQTIALLPTSPAVDAGSNTLAVEPLRNMAIPDDARGDGFARIIDGTVDIGAYELVPPASTLSLTVSTQPPSNVATNADFGLTVTVDTLQGNVATSYVGPVTIALVGPTSATLGGTLTVDAVAGVATFSGLSLNQTGGFTISATSGATIGVTTGAIQVQGPPRIVNESIIATGKGAHRKINGIKLTFNEALTASSAQNAAAYAVTQMVKQGRAVKSQVLTVTPTYNASSDSVTLKFTGRPTFTRGGKLVVRGTGPNRLMSLPGVALDGRKSGTAGTNATFTILANGAGI
jgi:hypothetical protein